MNSMTVIRNRCGIDRMCWSIEIKRYLDNMMMLSIKYSSNKPIDIGIDHIISINNDFRLYIVLHS